jgi:hypothetical protein
MWRATSSTDSAESIQYVILKKDLPKNFYPITHKLYALCFFLYHLLSFLIHISLWRILHQAATVSAHDVYNQYAPYY